MMNRPEMHWHYTTYCCEADLEADWEEKHSRLVTLTGNVVYEGEALYIEVEYLRPRFFGLFSPKIVRKWVYWEHLHDHPFRLIVSCS